jgi:hypothetical protein
MALYIGFLNETHRSSSHPVAYLKGARLEQNGEAEGEEEQLYCCNYTPETYPGLVKSQQSSDMQFRFCTKSAKM